MNNKIRKEFAKLESQVEFLQNNICEAELTDNEKIYLSLMVLAAFNGFVLGKVKSLNHDFDDIKAGENTMQGFWQIAKGIKEV